MSVTQIVHGREVISQKRSAYSGPNAYRYLDALLRLVTAIEIETRHKWKITSFIRDSPNHQHANALDIAPDIAPDSAQYYAVTHGSDPVLYKRTPLIRQLQRVCRDYRHPNFVMGIFIEPDHLHLQLFPLDGKRSYIRVYKWKGPKPCYPDTYKRMKLPMTSTGYL